MKKQEKKLDLHIIGVSTLDTIYNVSNLAGIAETSYTYSSKIRTWGGVGNFIPALSDSKLSVEITTWGTLEFASLKYKLPDNITININIKQKDNSALILEGPGIGLSGSRLDKVSYVNWADNKQQKSLKRIPRSRWTHISYLDILENLDLKPIKENTEILSADVCLTNPSKVTIKKVLQNLKYLDYIFLSTNEIDAFNSTTPLAASSLVKVTEKVASTLNHYKMKTNAICHSPYWATIVDKRRMLCKKNDFTSTDIEHVVGAGDKFCAKFIEYLLNSKEINDSKLMSALVESQKRVVKCLDKHVSI